MKRASRPTVILAGLALIWGSLAVPGYLLLVAHQATPGLAGSPPKSWPDQAMLPLDGKLPTLLIFVHPRCPCSSASLVELSEVVSRCQGRFAVNLLSFQPDQPAEEWKRSDQTTRLAIPGLTRWADRGGREARRFGIETSGHVLLYDHSGRLVFSGGITPSRGHQGSNRGLDDLIATIMDKSIGSRKSPVFGCSVLAPNRLLPEEGIP